METMSVDRLLPCPRCRYDLRGRVVGEQCPECGWTIDAAAPAWWNDGTLRRMRAMALLACLPCWFLLIVPALFVFAIAAQGDWLGAVVSTITPRADWFGVVLGAFCILMPVQVIAQCTAMLLISARTLGGRRSILLRGAAIARLLAFLTAPLMIYIDGFFAGRSDRWDDLLVVSYFVLPFVAVASDVVTVFILAGFRKECGLLLPRDKGLLPKIARGSMWVVYPLGIVPFIGWFFAPIIWTIAMAVCFGELRRVADASRALRTT